MNVSRIAAHGAAAAAGSAVWLTGVNLAAGSPPAVLQAVAVLPWLVASLSYALAHHVDELERRPAPRPATYSPRAEDAGRRLVLAPAAQKELAR